MSNNAISRREQILQTLAQMLETEQGNRITTAALASQVGVSEAALYRHFPSKAKMFDALIEFVEESIFSRTNLIQQQGLSTAQQCQQILCLLLTFVERNPGISRLLTGEALVGEHARLRSRINQLFERLETHLKQILRQAEINEGQRTAATPTTTANLLMAVCEGRIRQFVRSEFRHLPTTDWPEQWLRLASSLYQ
jgi:TetR/AcrR family transcriptional regulator